jgi:hypothetical protein
MPSDSKSEIGFELQRRALVIVVLVQKQTHVQSRVVRRLFQTHGVEGVNDSEYFSYLESRVRKGLSHFLHVGTASK